jgi:hypothetical protein
MKPTNPSTKYYLQEAVRKSVERVFGALFQRFNIIYQPSRLYDKVSKDDFIYTCFIIHNMVVECKSEGFSGTKNACITHLLTHVGTTAQKITEPESLKEASIFWMARLGEEDSPHLHRALKDPLASMM